MKAIRFLLGALLCLPPLVFSQQTSQGNGTQNAQDVPQQQPQGTNSPDLMKQRRPAPDSSQQGSSSDRNSQDVPQQQPGTNNPDVSKQRQSDKSGSKGSGSDSGGGSTTHKKSKGNKGSTSGS